LEHEGRPGRQERHRSHVVGTRRHRSIRRAAASHDIHGRRRRTFRFSLNCFSRGHEAGEVDSIEEAKLKRCQRCGGQVFIERDSVMPVYAENRRPTERGPWRPATQGTRPRREPSRASKVRSCPCNGSPAGTRSRRRTSDRSERTFATPREPRGYKVLLQTAESPRRCCRRAPQSRPNDPVSGRPVAASSQSIDHGNGGRKWVSQCSQQSSSFH